MKIARLSAAALIVAASCSAALASNVEIYGMMDSYVEAYSNGDTTTARLSSGGAGGSRLGFRGTEQIGGGLEAFYNLEMGLLSDSGTSTPEGNSSGWLFQRGAYVGLRDTWGTLSMGRQYTPTFTALVSMDPTGLALGSAIGSFTSPMDRGVNGGFGPDGSTRMNNSLVYVSPNMAGFQLTVMGALGEKQNSNTQGNYYGANLRYVNGNLNMILAAAAHKAMYHVNDEGHNYMGNDTQVIYGVSYDFGWVKPVWQIAYKHGDDKHKAYKAGEVVSGFRTGNAKKYSDSVLATQLAASAPVPGGTLIGSVAYAHNYTMDKADAVAAALRYDYKLSKRTFLYVGAQAVWNEDNADYNISAGGGSSAGLDTEMGKTASTFFAGVNHKF